MRRALPARAFSLVEIVVALGILAFCLSALSGLFSVGQMASRDASADTSLAAAASHIISKFKTEAALNSPGTTLPATYTYYFGQEGEFLNPQPASEAEIKSKARYLCTVTDDVVPESQVTHTAMVLPDGTSHATLRRITIEFKWPVTAAKPLRTFHAMRAVPYAK
jgi:uncharacterized protein (TIGR02598 family)